jgi:general stress protein YciG
MSKRTETNGFASMTPEEQREIAKKGGVSVSRNREHMAMIGRKGGAASAAAKQKRKNETSTESNKDAPTE